MILRVLGHGFHYEGENLCRVFFPHEKITVTKNGEGEDSFTVTTFMREKNGKADINVSIVSDGEKSERKCTVEKAAESDSEWHALCEKKMMTELFYLLSEYTGYTPKWGILTGVRPSKLMTSLISTMGDGKAKEYFEKDLLVQKDKTELAFSVAKAEEKIISLSAPESFSLYVSVPFCPTRCSYCSFVSHSIEHAGKLIPEYVENLCTELEYTAQKAKDLNLRLESVYWGGGTPTTLSAGQIEKICAVIDKNFDMSYLREYTVEAGRPDTVTAEKLAALKAAGITRLSINPQTFNDNVLENIGRRHTSKQTLDAFKAARDAGFDNINTDLIAGLTSDTFESFCHTLDTVLSLSPENITLHTLALKRSSRLVTGKMDIESGALADQMLLEANSRFIENKYEPYYMYRQSRSLGNLENVGWCKKGRECLYNVFMMEECHTVLAAGAGAVTKLKEYGVNNIQRIFNFKYPYEYNTRFGEILERKKRITSFYDEFDHR